MCLLWPERGWTQRVRFDMSEAGYSTHLTGLHAADATLLIREVFREQRGNALTLGDGTLGQFWHTPSVRHCLDSEVEGENEEEREMRRERERESKKREHISFPGRGNASDDRHPVFVRQWWEQLGASAVQDWLQIKYRWIRRTWLKKMTGYIPKMYIQKE